MLASKAGDSGDGAPQHFKNEVVRSKASAKDSGSSEADPCSSEVGRCLDRGEMGGLLCTKRCFLREMSARL